MATQDIGSYCTTLMVYGMPPPALLTFMLYKTPHLIHFAFINFLDDHMEYL